MDFLLDLLLFPFHWLRRNRPFSAERKMRRAASNWLELAGKVRHYRRDRLSAAEAAELDRREADLRQRLREGSDAGALRLAIEGLEEVLRRTGGAIYPKSSLAENVDFFLVAAIVILGIRAYFVQPFKIPTNSMWPTFYGMTAVNYPPGQPAPGWAARAWRLIVLGAQRREALAPRSGEVTAQFLVNGNALTPSLAYSVRAARKWLVIPTQVSEYTFYVDGAPARLQVPVDFHDFDDLVIRTYFGDTAGFYRRAMELQHQGRLKEEFVRSDDGTESYDRAVVTIPLGTVKEGEPVLRFDLLTGDQLFVDRVSYNFVRPRVGQGFVFRTNLIPGIDKDDYYIKRLVGVPGDVLEIRQPVLYRNGRPITGSRVFQLEANRVPPYRGYFYGPEPGGPAMLGLLRKGQTLTVPAGSYFAMGDNSILSDDGRYWGFVPAASVIGHPLFIYYPFTRRWGPAH